MFISNYSFFGTYTLMVDLNMLRTHFFGLIRVLIGREWNKIVARKQQSPILWENDAFKSKLKHHYEYYN